MDRAQRWQRVRADRGKPRVFIQQLLELQMPEADYLAAVKEFSGASDAFAEEAAAAVIDRFLEDAGEESQFDSVHVTHQGGTVLLLTVLSYPFRQATFDQLTAQYVAKKAVNPGG